MIFNARAARVMFVVVALFFVCASSVRAATVQVRDAVGGESATGEPGWFFLTGTGSLTNGTINGSAFGDLRGGTYDFEADYGAGWEALLTYCLQPDEGIGFGLNSGTAVGLPYELTTLDQFPGITPDDERFLEILWSNAFADSFSVRARAAAFQMLVWEVVRDGIVDLRAGTFQLNGAADAFSAEVLAIAEQWIGNIEGGPWTTRTDLMLLTHPESQDFLTPIPEPATLSLIVIGAGLALNRRKR